MIKFKIIPLLCLGLLMSYLYSNFFSSNMLVGKYEIKNNGANSLPDMPYIGDTLVIYDDKHFKSNYWGEGTYKLKYSLTGTKINLIYKYEFGNAGFDTSIERKYFLGKIIVILNYDSDIYFERIN